MSEYLKLLAKNGIRFTGSQVTLSPQLEDYGLQNILNPVASERKVEFRIVLYVPCLESNEVRIIFPTKDIMEVHMEHGQREMGKGQGVLWSRDCRYMYRLPKGVSKDCLTATWTHDNFLIIQARVARPLAASVEKELVDQLIPSRICAVLRPHLDVSILEDFLLLHQTEVDEICEYLEAEGTVPKDRDVLEMLKSFPGKLKRPKRKATEETQSEQELEGESEKTNLEVNLDNTVSENLETEGVLADTTPVT